MKTFLLAVAVVLIGCASSLAQPVIVVPPTNTTNAVGSVATFSVIATGVPPLFYQWRFGASFVTFGPLPSETNATLLLTGFSRAGGHCDVIVSNAGGSVTSATVRLFAIPPPDFLSHPSSVTVTQGGSASFSVRAALPSVTNYQWQLNGRELSGETRAVLSNRNVHLRHAGAYTCVLTDGPARNTSVVARLTVLPLKGVTPSFVNFETAPVHPLALSPDGVTLAACNLPDNRLELFDVRSGIPVALGSIPVGLDPVSVRFRTANEIWVVNHISDSISIVDASARRVVATLTTLDTPADVAFAGNPVRAFVSCALPNALQVFDPETRQAVAKVPIHGERPKALAVSPDHRHVYAAIFESGNGSTILASPISDAFGAIIPASPVDDAAGPYRGENPPPNRGAEFSPPLNTNTFTSNGLSRVPSRVAHIVKKSDNGRWLDDNHADWTDYVSGSKSALTRRTPGWDLADNDVAVVDAETFTVRYVRRLMNICMDLAVNPDTGWIAVIGTDALNEVRFEPNLKGVFLRIKLALVNPATGEAAIRDLNPHLDYSTSIIPLQERLKSIGDPRAIVWSGDGDRAYVAGMGSGNVIALDATGSRALSNPIEVGDGPSGLALDKANERLYVLNRFDASISVVDTDDNRVSTVVPFFDPTPQIIRAGRGHLYGTHKNSGLGHVSCASCHVDARMDRLAWDLGDPAGKLATNLVTGLFQPMKGPMVTITFQDMIGHEPFHWRGDRLGLEEFNPTFTDLLGAPGQLTTDEMAEFKTFLGSIHFPPNPFRQMDNSFSTNLPLPGHFALGFRQLPAGTPLPNGNAERGRQLFSSFTCIICHRIPAGLSAEVLPPDTDDNHRLVSQSLGRNANLPFKGSQLRNLAEKVGMDTVSTNGRAGFGFTFNGRADSLTRFLQISFPGEHSSDQITADTIAFLLSFSGSDLAPAQFPDGPPSKDVPASVGRQITLNEPVNSPLLETMLSIAALWNSRVDLVVKGYWQGVARGWSYDRWLNVFQSDRASECLLTSELLALAGPGNELTFTMVPWGSGKRIGIDRDDDGFFDRDELDAGSDPARASSVPLRVAVRLGAANEVIITWNSIVGRKYRVETKPELNQASWIALTAEQVADANSQTITDPEGYGARRFYRVVQVD